jgi:hypothetical protein
MYKLMLFTDGSVNTPSNIGNGAYLVPVHEWLFYPITASGKNFNSQNITYIPAVKFFPFLVLEQNILFGDRNYLSVPENLLEIELFGYVAGAFTGAVKDKSGV